MSNIRRSSQENNAIQNLSNCLFNSLSYEAPPFCNHRHYVQRDRQFHNLLQHNITTYCTGL